MKSKRRAITLSDILRIPGILKCNPELAKLVQGGPGGTVTLEVSATTSIKPKKIRISSKPKTRPEREMDLMLKRQREAGEIQVYKFEGATFQIGDGVRYTPDFMVVLLNGHLRFVEVKGPFIREDSIVKYKVFKGENPWFEVELWSLTKDGWTRLS